jgi:hypothetical protein
MIASVIHLERSVLRRMISKEKGKRLVASHPPSEQNLYSLAVESSLRSYVIQKVKPVKVRSLVAATVKYDFIHSFSSDQGTGMAYALGVALQPSSQSIRSPSASLPSAVPLHLSFQRIQSSVLLGKGGESWRMCYHGDWAERYHARRVPP